MAGVCVETVYCFSSVMLQVRMFPAFVSLYCRPVVPECCRLGCFWSVVALNGFFISSMVLQGRLLPALAP